MNEGAFGHIVRRKAEGPTYEEMFVAMSRMLKRCLQHLTTLEGDRKDLVDDIRAVLPLVDPVSEILLDPKAKRDSEMH